TPRHPSLPPAPPSERSGLAWARAGCIEAAAETSGADDGSRRRPIRLSADAIADARWASQTRYPREWVQRDRRVQARADTRKTGDRPGFESAPLCGRGVSTLH